MPLSLDGLITFDTLWAGLRSCNVVAGILGCLVPEIFHQLLLSAKRSDAAKKKKRDDLDLLTLEPVVDPGAKTVGTPK